MFNKKEAIAERYTKDTPGTPPVTPEKAPETQEAPKAPETPETPETPAATTEPVEETPKATETPKSTEKTQPTPEEPTAPKAEDVSGFDAIAQNTENAAPTEEPKVPEVPRELQDKADSYDLLMEDKRVKSYVDYLNNGGSIQNFAKEVGLTDYDQISDDQIVRQELESGQLSRESVDEEMERFEEKSYLERKEQADRLRAKGNEKNQKALNNFNAVSAEQQEQIRIEKKRTEQMHLQGAQELQDYLDKLQGRKIYNLQITPEVRKSLEEFSRKFMFQKFDARGQHTGFDVEGTVKAATFVIHEKEMMQSYGQAKYDMGRIEELNKRHRPSDVTSVPSNTPVPQDSGFEQARKQMVTNRGSRQLFTRTNSK